MTLTGRRVAALGIESVKLHHLYVVNNTALAKMWKRGLVPLPSLEEYAEEVVDVLETLSPDMVVERVAGETSAEYLLAPDWTAIKHAGRNAVDMALRRRNSWQGKRFAPNFRDQA